MQQISEHVYGILTRGQFVNMYLIANGDNLALVDIALGSGDVDTVEKELATKGWSLENIKHILITHAHPDHIGGLAALQKRVNAPTYVHRLDAPQTRGEKPQVFAKPSEVNIFWRMMMGMMKNIQTTPARVDIELNGNEKLSQIFDGLEVVHLPGHSYGQCGFWLPSEGVLIGGDVLMNFPWGLSYPLRAPSPDWLAVKESILKVIALSPKFLCLGHGKVLEGDVAAKVQAVLG